jgi:hypothetical protein
MVHDTILRQTETLAKEAMVSKKEKGFRSSEKKKMIIISINEKINYIVYIQKAI